MGLELISGAMHLLFNSTKLRKHYKEPQLNCQTFRTVFDLRYNTLEIMLEPRTYLPYRRLGAIFHFAMLGLLLAIIVIGMWQASRAESNQAFLLYLSPAVISGALVPLFGYRLYGLQNGKYSIARDGIQLRWGWRSEDIPANAVEWVGYGNKLGQPVPLPFWIWPGAVVGLRCLADGRLIEFLASRTGNLVLIATPQRVFALSPADPGDFLLTYQRLTEFGSLTPMPAQSVFPGSMVTPLGMEQPGRTLLVSNMVFSLGLFLLVALAIPSHDQVSLRFTPQGQPLDYVPAVRLFLLPVINLLFILAGNSLGFIFHRRAELRPLSYLLWGTGLITSGLFLVAVIFILRIS
jgi:hypothetical protein